MLTTKRKLIIVGAGEFARIAYAYFTADTNYGVAAFSVEQAYLTEPALEGLPIVPFEELTQLYPPTENDLFVAVPATRLNSVRSRLATEALANGYSLATYVSPNAFVWKGSEVGKNCFIFEGCTIQPFTEIGNNVIMWSGSQVAHRTVIEDNCFLASHVALSGYCRIGDSSYLGVNSTFRDNISVAERCIVGAGSVVVKSLLDPDSVYFGNPARKQRGDSSTVSL